MSRMICIATPRVKPTRHASRPAANFGAGILRALPYAGRMPYTTADEAWYVANVVAETAAAAADRRMDEQARESLELDRMCAGHAA
jgi:hypothetical protein